MLRPATLVSALLLTLALAACSSSDPSSGTTAGSTTGTGGSTGQGGEGGQGAGTFACKTETCQAGKEQCDVDAMDVGACFPLPKACIQKAGEPAPTCACFTSLTADCACQQDPKGNFVVQCTMM